MNFAFDSEILGPWICEKAGGEWKGEPCIGLKEGDEIAIAVMYDQYTGGNVYGHIRCDDPNKVSKKFFPLAFDYPFNQLKVKRFSAIVKASNDPAKRLLQKLGFNCEHVLRDYFPDGDAILFVMYRKDCRFLESKYAVQRI